jgi:hypothetical protein
MSRLSPRAFVLLPPAWSCLGTPMDSVAGVSQADRPARKVRRLPRARPASGRSTRKTRELVR